MTFSLSRTVLLIAVASLFIIGCSGTDNTADADTTGTTDTTNNTNNTAEQADTEDAAQATLEREISEKSSRAILGFTQFLEERNISEGAIAVAYDGKLVDSAGVNRQAIDNAPVASLSKAITAVCTMKALDKGNYLPSATLREVMPETLASLDMRDERLPDITIKQLLTHNSGLHTPHVSVMGSNIPTMRLEQKMLQLEFIAADGLSAAPGSGYEYANSNYLILGLAIEAIVEEDYTTYCGREVLETLGIDTATLSPLWTFLSSYGGWAISATDYLTFINAYFKPDDMLGEDPATTTLFVVMNGGDDVLYPRYSIGTNMRLTSDGAVYWHGGSFTWRSLEQSGRFGSFFAIYNNGYSVSVNLSEDMRDGRGFDIDNMLYQVFN